MAAGRIRSGFEGDSSVSELTFGQLEACASHIARVAEEKRYTFQSRLKQWQKMGFPSGTKVGRGTKVKYTLTHLLQIVLMMQLLRMGLTPERSIKMVNKGWPQFRQGLVEAIDHIAEEEPVIMYAVVTVNALGELEGWAKTVEETVSVYITNDAELTALYYGINEADEDDEAAVKAEEEKRGYSSDAWVEWLRMVLSDALVIELNVVVMSSMFSIAQGLGLDPESFAPEVENWRKESEEWKAGEGKDEECRICHVLKRDTANPTWRSVLMDPAKLVMRRLTRKPIDLEELEEKLSGARTKQKEARAREHGDDQETQMADAEG